MLLKLIDVLFPNLVNASVRFSKMLDLGDKPVPNTCNNNDNSPNDDYPKLVVLVSAELVAQVWFGRRFKNLFFIFLYLIKNTRVLGFFFTICTKDSFLDYSLRAF